MRRELKWALIGLAVLVVCSALVAPASGARYAKNLKATLQANAQESSSENSKTDGTKSEESKASTSGESSTKASESSTKATSGESSSKSGESSTKSGESSTKSGESSTKATSGESSTGGESSKASTSGESSKAASENSASKEGENSGPKAESSTQQAESSENSETSSGAEESTQAQESTQASEASEAAGEESGGEESSETSRDAIHDWDPSQCFKVEKKKKIIPKTFEKHPLEDSEEGGSGSGESEASCESYDKFPEAEQKPLNEVGLGFSDKMNLATPVHDKANEVAEGADAKHVQMRKDHDKNCEGGVCPKSKSGAVEATTA